MSQIILSPEIKESLEQVRSWYHSFSFPAPTTKKFSEMVASVQGIISTIRSAHQLPNIPAIFDASIQTAQFDGDVISIGTSYVTDDFYPGVDEYLPELMIAIVTGLAIHETGHSVHSRAFFNRSIRNITNGMQIVEDWYLETNIRRAFPQFIPFMQTLSEFFFPIEQFAMTTAASSDKVQHVAINMKNLAIVDQLNDGRLTTGLDVTVESKLFDIFNRTLDTHILDERIKLGHELDALFTQEHGSTSHGTGGYQQGSVRNDRLRNHNGKKSANRHDIRNNGIRMAKQINSALIANSTDKTYGGLEVIDYTKDLDGIRPIKSTDERFLKFADYIKKATSVTGQAPMRSTQGRINNRALHRAFVDGKAFTPRNESGGKKRIGHDRVAAAILIDVSGSTGYEPDQDGRTIFSDFIKIGYALCQSFDAAGQPFYAAAFSTWSRENTIFKLSEAFKRQSMDVISKAFAQLERRGFGGGNPDAMAIEHAASRFPKDADQKLIIVINDGEPSSGYFNAEQETKDIVTKLRKDGFTIAAVTYGKQAAKKVALIYGSEWTLDATDSITNVQAILNFAATLIR